MTKNKILAAFNDAGIASPFNTWMTLHNVFNSIGLHKADNNIAVDYRTVMFYFNEDDEMVYLRHFDGTVYEYNSNSKLYDGDITFTVNDKTYFLRCLSCYKTSTDDNIGEYHEAISFDQITSFTYINALNKFSLYF